MNFWASFFFVRYALWLIAGILAGLFNSTLYPIVWPITLVLSGCYLLFFLFRNYFRPYPIVQGLIGSILIFLLGYGITVEKQEAANLSEFPAENSYLLIEAETGGVKTAKTLKVQARVLAIRGGREWQPSEGRFMLYIKKAETQRVPSAGEIWIVNAQLNPIPEPLNPSVFNYKEYLASKGIKYQCFVSADKVSLTNLNLEYPIIARALEVREKAGASIQKWIEGKQEAAIIKALVLGAKDTLDDEIKQAYATAGVMHVLAVSGLHVGFIYAFLNFIFRYWRRSPYLKWAGFICVVLVLSGYAFITGLSPSVIRAAFMFIMFDLAIKLKRKSNIWNTLAVAAFVLLVYNPYNLKAVGFQLSFLAVAGIVYMAPKINSWYKGESKWAQKVWGLMAVSLAAQLATFPLGLYYFGQFPTYFFITNLIIVPAAGLILGLGFLLLLMSAISSVLAFPVGVVLNGFMSLINGFVLFAETLPYSRLQGSISEFQLLLLIGSIIFILLLLRFKAFPWAVVSFLTLCLFLSSLIYQSFIRKQQTKLLVYHIPAYSALHLIEGESEFFMADDDLPEDRFNFQVQPHRRVLGLVSGEQEQVVGAGFEPALHKEQNYSILVWRGSRLVHLHKPLSGAPIPKNEIEVDYLLISHDAVKNLDELRGYFNPKMLVIDGSNKQYRVKSLQKQAEELNLLCHITAEKGAFELALSP